jgi:hypothetical protein
MKKSIYLFFDKFKYQIVLVFLILLIFYPLSLFIYIPKWDNVNAYLPYRFFVSDYVWNGHLPLWNPFQNMGYPGYSDLQSGCWYPVVWLLMLFGKYDITSLQIELLLTLIIAGLGMFKLSLYFHHCKKTAFILALSFAASGFMTGTNQLLVFLIGVAWLPWCIWSLLSFFKTFDKKYIFLSALFFALETTGASPAFTIILIYIYFFMFIYAIWQNRLNITNVKKIIFASLLIIACTFLLLLPYIQSFLEFAPYFGRGEKLPYQAFLIQNPFSFQYYISFLFPYTVISASEIFMQTDLSLRNVYIGIIGIFALFFTLTNLKKFTRNHKILILCGFLALLIALGNEFFAFKYLYHLPGFGFFRHPSFFRIYAMLCFLLLAGYWIKTKITTKEFSKFEKYIGFSFLLVLVFIIFISYSKTSFEEVKLLYNNILNNTEFHSTFLYTHLFFNALILLVLSLFCLCLYRLFKVSIFTTFVLFAFSDLIIQSALTAPTTIHYNLKHKDLKAYFRGLSNEHNQKYNESPFKILDDTQGLKSVAGIWQNVATFNKTISSVGINPIRFKSFDQVQKNGKIKFILENSLFYFPKKYYKKNDSLSQGLIWNVPEKIKLNQENQIRKVKVFYNEFSAEIKNSSNSEQYLVLNQNYHHLWKAEFNKKELTVFKVNELVLGVKIPEKSSGKITFSFTSPFLIYSFLISLTTYLFLIFLLFKLNFKSIKKSKNP